MTKVERIILFIFILGLILFVGLIFSGWVVPNIVQPAAQTIWLFLRMSILIVDQVDYLSIFTIAIVIWVIYRFARKIVPVRQEDATISNEAINNLKNWQEFINYAHQDGSLRGIARDKLLRLVVSHYAVGQPSVDQVDIRQDLEQHRLPLPDSVYGFLFQSKPGTTKDSIKEILFQPLRRWQRRITGQEKLEFNHMIDELIDFMNS